MSPRGTDAGAMKGPRFEEFEAASTAPAAFEEVRNAVGIYGAIGPEPLPPGARGLIAWDGERPLARGSLFTARDLQGAPGVTGMIGHYEARDAGAGAALLRHGCARLAARGAARVLGPMNGGTWMRYRLALRGAEREPEGPAGAAPSEDPPFLAEPWNPEQYPAHFRAAGFGIAARYESRIDEAPGRPPADADALAAAVRAAGIRLRPLDLARFDAELEILFRISLESFADNLYYSPLDFATFRPMYEKIRPIVDPEFVLIAEDPTGAPLAFQFAFLDPLTVADGRPTRAIVKTIATLPAARGRGLGAHMMDTIHRRAHERGCRGVIHALMHVTNFSMNMSARHRTRELRRYALFEWKP